MLDPTRRFPDGPPRREPVFNIPVSVLAVLGVLVGLHASRQFIPEDWDSQILLHLAFFPGAFTNVIDPAAVMDALRDLGNAGEAGLRQAQIGQYVLSNGGAYPWSLLTYGLLHADWAHLGLNALWLLAFGSPVARRLGTSRFLAFLAAATLAGAAAHALTHLTDVEPVIGASAAVSGCMGAALRFMFQPRRSASAIIAPGEPERDEAFHQPLLSLRGIMRDRRAMAFLVVWLIANLLFGVGIVALGTSGSVVAWQAHIGGFLMGLLGLPLFDRRTPEPGSADPEPLPEPGSVPEPDR